MAAKDVLGKAGEELAAQFLLQRAYEILDRNWRCSQGEIDLIARHEGVIVFVEVKTRSTGAFGHPFEAITPSKLARLRRLASTWCSQAQLLSSRIRIDAIAVIGAGEDASIEHLRGVC